MKLKPGCKHDGDSRSSASSRRVSSLWETMTYHYPSHQGREFVSHSVARHDESYSFLCSLSLSKEMRNLNTSSQFDMAGEPAAELPLGTVLVFDNVHMHLKPRNNAMYMPTPHSRHSRQRYNTGSHANQGKITVARSSVVQTASRSPEGRWHETTVRRLPTGERHHGTRQIPITAYP